ncbi:FadR/GntR family transcriptional regulator [uncultured Caulobacter sp.]|uniref:FadR/GntR family transcriptional regulator n=1 Tax=uncultured Caulobacter sp. TaxID=158749 RepID=UPI00260A8A07|nr:FadR/GntR family transcriptional regulator [uncultured Caulobacter sp.]
MAARAKGGADRATVDDGAITGDRIYQRLARHIFDDLLAGRYALGSRLPAERELCAEYGASRPAVREALIALEVQGYIDIRVGSGAYVRKLPGREDHPGFAITAFELTETRLAFEGEAAALAAKHVTDDEVAKLEGLLEAMTEENLRAQVTEDADREFHMTIARATRNAGIVLMIDELWRLRSTSPACALLHDKARSAKIRPVVAEHRRIVEALKARDPQAARTAMRAHLAAVMDHLLFTTEEMALEEARRAAAGVRARFSMAADET